MERIKPYVLITNDDGIDSPGIFALVSAFRKFSEVIVVAPDRQQSAVGHALSVAKPLRVTKFHRDGKMFGYAINGTPTDCVKIAVSTLLDKMPDLVVSGINHGQNTSVNILYSGTVSAATEGMLLGIPSIAVSLASYNLSADCSLAADTTVQIAKFLLKNGLKRGTFLNVNVPDLPSQQIKGLLITRHSNSYWKDRYEKRTDPFGHDYYWFAGEYTIDGNDADSDDLALLNGYISVTPVHYFFTDLEIIPELNSLKQYFEKK